MTFALSRWLVRSLLLLYVEYLSLYWMVIIPQICKACRYSSEALYAYEIQHHLIDR